MKRVSLDAENPEVQKFIQRLPLESEGIELELQGRLVCVVIPSFRYSDAEKENLVQERWELIRRAQQRNQGVPADVIEREVQDAVGEVRRCARR